MLKTNSGLDALCGFIENFRPDLASVAGDEQGACEMERFNIFCLEYVRRAIEDAGRVFPSTVSIETPTTHPVQQVSAFYLEERRKNGVIVFKDRIHTYTTIDCIALVQEPTFLYAGVEMRPGIGEKSLRNYFKLLNRKREVMEDVCHEFGWALMLPSDYRGSESKLLDDFRKEGGKVVIVPYRADELRAGALSGVKSARQ